MPNETPSNYDALPEGGKAAFDALLPLAKALPKDDVSLVFLDIAISLESTLRAKQPENPLLLMLDQHRQREADREAKRLKRERGFE